MVDPNCDCRPAGTPKRGPYKRRLSDKIISAFHIACDRADYAVAEALLNILDFMAARPVPGERRRHEMEVLIAAHERLWHLRHHEPESEGVLERV
jgi:hypothetical protein